MKPVRVSLSERLYARILRVAYPRDFCRSFGSEMRELFRDHHRAARARSGSMGVLSLWLRTIPDLFLTGIHLREEDMLHAIMQDARYAGRILRKNPVFTLVAIAVVALGTGAVSTIFSVANAVILRPIPGVANPSAVVNIHRMRADGGESRSSSFPYYQHIAKGSKTMAGIAAWDFLPITISSGGEGTLAHANLVTGNYFDVLGVRPAVGRFFAPDEDRVPDASAVVVISHEFWQRRFNGDSAIVGRPVLVNGRQFTVIGVAQRRFTGLFPVLRTDAWVPMMMQPSVRRGRALLTSPGAGWLELVGRVAPGVSTDAAVAELTGLTKQFAASVETGPLSNQGEYTRVRLMKSSGLPADATKGVLAFFVVLIGVSGLVLLIASVNVASMLLARAVARRREIAVRLALGAARGRLIRQLLTESLILFAVGGVFGVLLSVVLTRLLSRIPLPVDVPLLIDATPDFRVLAVTIAVSMITGIVFGLAPALQGSGADVATTLRGDTAGSGRTRSRLRSALVAGQVAASLLLLTTSGLFIRALAKGHDVDPGYDISNVVTAALDVGLSGYDEPRARAFYAQLRERVRGLPGVTSVSYARVLPLSMNNTGFDIAVPGYVRKSGRDDGLWSNANVVDADYFETFKLPVIAGRPILSTDDQRAPGAAVVSKAFADRFWPGVDPLGRTFKLDSTTTLSVVGVVPDVRFSRLDEPVGPFFYMPTAQRWRSDANLVVRTSGDPAQLIAAIRAAVRGLDPILPPPVTVTMERSSAAVLLPQRFAAIVTASLGVAGLILAGIGLYGVVSFSTAQRTREIGVRMALGAARGDVVGLIVREGMRVVMIGIVIGLVLAVLGTRMLRPFLFGVNPLDVTTFVAMTAILGGTATLASFLPARRAASADPVRALRQD